MLTYFTPDFSVFIVNFEHVIVGWVGSYHEENFRSENVIIVNGF